MKRAEKKRERIQWLSMETIMRMK